MWFALALLLQPAFADEPLTEAQRDEQARTLFQEGRDNFNDGRFEEAVLNWEKAYALSERPLILFNLAEAYERVGEFDAALNALEAYRPHAEKSEEAQVDARIDSLRTRASIETKEKQAAEAEKKAKEAQLEAERLRAEELARKAQELEQQVGQKKPSIVGPVVVLGVGVAGLGVASVTGLGASSARRQLDDPAICAESGLCKAEAQDLVKRQSTQALITDVALIGGVAATAVGTVWLIRQLGAKKKAKTAWATPTPQGIQVGVAGAF